MTKEEFKKIRESLGWSQDKLAKRLRVFVRTVQRYEGGQTKTIPDDVVEKMRGLK